MKLLTRWGDEEEAPGPPTAADGAVPLVFGTAPPGTRLLLRLWKRLERSENHRMVGLEGTPRIMKFQPLCHGQGFQPPDLVLAQAARGPIQPGLGCLQGWGTLSFSGQLYPTYPKMS